MLISIVKAKHIEEFQLYLQFNDGESGIVDLWEMIYTERTEKYNKLKDLEYFKEFTLNSWTILWEDWLEDIELDPEMLYNMVKESKEEK